MPSADENAAIIRKGYDLFNTGNLDELAKIFADGVVWHAAGRGRFAGAKQGRDATFAYFGQLVEATGGTFHAEPHDVAASGDHVLGMHTATGTRNGRSVSMHEVLAFHLQDGRIVEVWELFEDTQAWDEFLA